jgi:hypothetical protein
MNRSSKGKSGKQKRIPKSGTPRKYTTPYFKIVGLTALVAVAVVAWILIQEKLISGPTEPEPSAQSQTHTAPVSDPRRYDMLLGRWQRPDGGYMIEISQVKPDGTLSAAYYNPRPINVSKARLQGKDLPIRIFIELNDVGYPGATYSLTYGRQNDVLKGVYYQPAVAQSFDVFFVRIN